MEAKSMLERILLGGVVLGSLVAAVVLSQGREGSPNGIIESAAVGSAPSTSQPVEPRAQHRAPTAHAAAELQRAIPPPIQMPAQLIEQVLQEDKKLALFMHYHRTVLLDEHGREEYRKILSDPEIMTAMAKDLMSPGQGEVEAKEHYHRLMQIDYFEAALHWKDNPQRQQLLELTRDIILEDNFSNSQDVDRQQMLAGGKVELYRLLYDNDMKQALDMVAQAKGTRMEKLANWMAEATLRRIAKEEEIRAEMQAMQQGVK